jgi:diketogulonate reductase-like aldo/keto reductase
MRYETVGDRRLPKIGLGTWKIGGEVSADRRTDKLSLKALHSALELGYTHLDTAEMYGGGHCEELIGQALHEARIERGKVFITTKVLPEHLKYEQVLRSCEGSLRRLRLDFVDLYLIHWPNAKVDLAETFRALNKLVADQKVRCVGVSNFNLQLLKEAIRLSERPILTNQVPYSVGNRSYVKNGVLEYCEANDILLTAYSPLDIGRLHTKSALRPIAASHATTLHQIALAWLCSQPRVITIPMSRDPKHQMENLEAADLVLSPREMQQME